jgi:hypothetical protein
MIKKGFEITSRTLKEKDWEEPSKTGKCKKIRKSKLCHKEENCMSKLQA